MIDIHCHILWGVDDGPQSSEETEALLNLAKAEGITDIIATSHYTPYLEQVYEKKFEEAANMARSVGINLYSGCEYKLQDALLLKDRLITLAGSDFILVEITSGILADFVYNQVYDLELAGYQVFLHIRSDLSCLLTYPSSENSVIWEFIFKLLQAALRESLAGRFSNLLLNSLKKSSATSLRQMHITQVQEPSFMMKQKVSFKRKNSYLKLLTCYSARTHPRSLAVNQV